MKLNISTNELFLLYIGKYNRENQRGVKMLRMSSTYLLLAWKHQTMPLKDNCMLAIYSKICWTGRTC